MRKLTIAFLFLVSIFAQLQAQDIESWITSKKPLLFEKLYLHVDRELYAPGDKIWLKAYQVNGISHQLNSNYRNIFVQLIAEDGRVIKDLMLFSIKGQAQGSFNTDSVASGLYTIRAYTKYLENYGEEACFHKKIRITGVIKSVEIGDMPLPDFSKIEVAFLPESGNLVLNAVNAISFKAIDQKGRGINVSGRIMNDLGDTIVSFSTSYRGMGKFFLMPVDGITYYAVIDQNPEMKIRLEPALADGLNLNYKSNEESLWFTMSSNMKMNSHPPFYFVASHKGVVLFYKKIEMVDYTQTLNLSKFLFPKGISKITLLDTTLNQLAERLIFVDDGKADLIKLQANKPEFKPREEITIDAESLLSSNDSINSTLSVAVVNNGYFGSGGNSQTIKSYLLLDSELKGAIESPASYFVDDQTISSSEKLDLLMMVNGWRAYLWDNVEASGTPNLDDWNDAGIQIKGFVKKLLWEAPLYGADLTLASAGGSFTIDKATSNPLGRFNFERIYLRNLTRVMINGTTKNGSKNLEIRLDPRAKMDSIVPVDSMRKTGFDVDLNVNFNRINSLRRMKELGFNPEKGSILLSEFELVKKRVNKDDGHFRLYSNPDQSLTVTQADQQYPNVLDYLQGKVSGLTISGEQVSIRGAGPPLFLVDGIEVFDLGSGALDEILRIPMREIDKVEVLKDGASLTIFGSKGANGVIAIYRKTIGELVAYANSYVKGRIETSIRGFHKPEKFYAPSYALINVNNPQPDYRPTLYWDPEFDLKSGKANINFYTSDELGDYVVFVEGISKNGKICFGTTRFSVVKK